MVVADGQGEVIERGRGVPVLGLDAGQPVAGIDSAKLLPLS
jgi:hypothetical protein